jgi:hypothetical protein
MIFSPVIIKYLVEFPDVPLKVSNDITLGDFTLDASIKVQMKRGSDGCTFQVDLFDLPKAKGDFLSILPVPTPPVSDPTGLTGGSSAGGDSDKKSALSDVGKKVVISLGYFDGTFAKVIDGVVDSAIATVQGEKLVTTIKGQETSTRALKLTNCSSTFKPGTEVYKAIEQLLADAKPNAKGGEFPNLKSLPPVANGKPIIFGNKSASGTSLMDGVSKLTGFANSEMLVIDKTLYVGVPIKIDSHTPPKFTPAVNLAKFEPFKKNIPPQTDPTVSKLLKETSADGFNFTTTGDPEMRPAQKISVDLDTITSGLEYRIQEVTHNFSTSSGYTCDGVVTNTVVDDNAKRREAQAKKPTADTIIDGLGQIASAHRKQSPSVEVGQIKSYTEGSASTSPGDPASPEPNTADVYLGQIYDTKETQPSIHVEVQNSDKQVAKGKPIISPFAWHKCGLIVPVYPGMKTVLSHDLALEDDSLVCGFIWSDKPAFAPPPNKKGDWWLSLPVFTGGGDPPIPPPDDTKIANDLTANSGLRVIEVSGLKITVGKMQTLGTRPTEGNADEFLIEHKKARIHIASDGSMEILADADGGKGKITVASGGDISMTATGEVTLKVGASAVEIS